MAGLRVLRLGRAPRGVRAWRSPGPEPCIPGGRGQQAAAITHVGGTLAMPFVTPYTCSLCCMRVAASTAYGHRPRRLVLLDPSHVVPTVSKQVKSASLEAASSSTCGGGWAPSGWGLTLAVPSCPEPPGAPWEGTAGELEHCEDGHFDGAVVPALGRAALVRDDSEELVPETHGTAA